MLIVGKTIDYAAKGGVANTALVPSDLDLGSVGFYGLDQGGFREVLITNASAGTGKVVATAFKGKSVKLCEGLGGGQFKVSETFDVKGVSLLSSSAYAAPAYWKGYIGYNGTTGSIIIGDTPRILNEVSFKIERRYINGEFGDPIFLDILLDKTGETQASIATKLAAAVNADGTFTGATATSGGNSGVSITAKEYYKDYRISLQGAIEQSPITYGVYDVGAGNFFNLRGWELESQAKHGDLYTLDREYKSVPTSLVDGATYDTYMIGATNTNVSGGYGGAGLAGNPSTQTTVSIQVAFISTGDDDDTNSNQVDFEAIIQALTGLTLTTRVEAGA